MGNVIEYLKIHKSQRGPQQSGNAGIDKKTGKAIIYDPASYYGHNEAEYEYILFQGYLVNSSLEVFLSRGYSVVFLNPSIQLITNICQRPSQLINTS